MLKLWMEELTAQIEPENLRMRAHQNAIVATGGNINHLLHCHLREGEQQNGSLKDHHLIRRGEEREGTGRETNFKEHLINSRE